MPVRLPRTAAFWSLAAILLALLFAAGAPSPLYVVYQARWGFSTVAVTVVFAVYAATLLVTLLVAGRLSDHVGRRPVLLAAIGLVAVAMGLFAAADGLAWLVAARAVQGVGTGLAMATAGGALLDLAPAGRPRLAAVVNGAAATAGLATGALGAGLLVDHAPAPTRLVYLLLVGVLAVAAGVVLLVPESSPLRPGAVASLRPTVEVPRRARSSFALATPVFVATWALGGLYLSLGPSVAAGVLGLHSHVDGGLVVFALAGTGSVAGALLGAAQPARTMLLGAAALVLGTAVTLAGVEATATPAFFVGTVIAGVGFGAGFLAAFRLVLAAADPTERAGLVSSVYVVSYVAFAVPAVLAGLAVPSAGLRTTTGWYAAGVIVLALVTAGGLLVQRRRAPQPAPVQLPAGEPSTRPQEAASR